MIARQLITIGGLLTLLCWPGLFANAQQISADKIANVLTVLTEILAQEQPITPASVQQQFSPLVVVKAAAKADEYSWRFVDSEQQASQIVRWLSVEFQPSEASVAQSWSLLQLQVALAATYQGGGSVYALLRNQLLEQFGPPAYGDDTQPGGRLAWSVGLDLEFILQAGLFVNPHTDHEAEAVLLEFVVLQGEAEG